MSLCSKCGSRFPDGQDKCPRCGGEPSWVGSGGMGGGDLLGAVGLTGLFLTVAQVVSVLGCLACVVAVADLTFGLGTGILPDKPGWLRVWLGAFVGFCYNAAMLIVFTRVKRLGGR